MEADPDKTNQDDEVESETRNPYTALKRRYATLQRNALHVQNALDDIAAALERAAALASWADPFATALALLACVAAAMLVAALGLSPVLAWGMCWLVRPPFLRKPTPPGWRCFLRRLPSKSDQII